MHFLGYEHLGVVNTENGQCSIPFSRTNGFSDIFTFYIVQIPVYVSIHSTRSTVYKIIIYPIILASDYTYT